MSIGINCGHFNGLQSVIATVEDAWKIAFPLDTANSNRVFFEQCVCVPLTPLNQQYRSEAFVCSYTLPDFPGNFETARKERY